MQILERERELGPPCRCERNGLSSSSSSSSSSSLLLAPFPFMPIDSFNRKSFSYNKLPQEPLHLSVVKLDGSSFDIKVVKTTTLVESKQAVEAAFRHLPQRGPGRVSWSHVWRQFCLCYNGQKLLADHDFIGSYGIKEGDKLHFIRHASTYYNLVKTRSGKEDLDSEQPRISSCIRAFYEEREKKDDDDDYCGDQENVSLDDKDDTDSVSTDSEFKFAGSLRGWFSYRRLEKSEIDSAENSSSNLSKLNRCFFGSFKNILRLCSNKDNSVAEPWKGE